MDNELVLLTERWITTTQGTWRAVFINGVHYPEMDTFSNDSPPVIVQQLVPSWGSVMGGLPAKDWE